MAKTLRIRPFIALLIFLLITFSGPAGELALKNGNLSVTMEDKRSRNLAILQHYMPEGTADVAYHWIHQYRFRFRISRSRHSRFGDYRSPVAGSLHKISVNHDLNKYAFLITFCHEVAHLITWEKYRDTVPPHGREWKKEFGDLLCHFMGRNIFPGDVEFALQRYILNPKASSCSDHELYRVLKRYDAKPVTHLEELPMGSLFSMGNGRIFRKGRKQRTRFLCQCLDDKQLYYVSGIAEVTVLAQTLALD